MSFDPHPRRFFQPSNQRFQLLFTPEEKEELLKGLGFDAILLQNFDSEFSKLRKEDFLDKVLIQSLKAEAVVVGRQFQFGFQAEGQLKDMEDHPQLRLIEVEDFRLDQQSVSSSRIREAVARGDIDEANRCLGYPYFLTGKVVGGDRVGTKWGVPTANLTTEKECVPAHGVYLSVFEDRETHQFYPSVTNIGLRPSVSGTEFRIESHLIDFRDDLYQRSARVFFLERMRDEISFESLEKLQAQIQKDVASARAAHQKLYFLQSGSMSTQSSLSCPPTLAQSFQALKIFK